MPATVYQPDFLFAQGLLRTGVGLPVDGSGNVLGDVPPDATVIKLPGRLLLPGFVNAHSHAFQRVLRGRTEYLVQGHAADDFWSWREAMYRAATALSPDDVYVASRQAFLEMVLEGITCVGEFHYLHHQLDGRPYDDEHLLAKQVVRAARDVGLRIALLRVGYARAGHGVAENPRQKRFIDVDVDTFLNRAQSLKRQLAVDPLVSVGLAPHSVRAVPKAWLDTIARWAQREVLHVHASEQPAEVAACRAEHGLSPVGLLADCGLLSDKTTLVHAIHVDADDVRRLGEARASVCACPSTERNLGDGVVPADVYLKAGVRLCLGSDSQAHIAPLEELRQLEGHLRLVRGRRNVLDAGQGLESGQAMGLLRHASADGAHSLGLDVGSLTPGQPADFCTVDVTHPSLAGLPPQALLAGLVFGAPQGLVREVAVQGRLVVQGGQHALAEETTQEFGALMRHLSLA